MTKSEELAQQLADNVPLPKLAKIVVATAAVVAVAGIAVIGMLGMAAWRLDIRYLLVAIVSALPWGLAMNVNNAVSAAMKISRDREKEA